MKRLVGLCGVLSALGAAPAAAQGGLSWSATAGFEGQYRLDAWTCVSADITNNGGAVKGELVVPVAYDRLNRYGGPPPGGPRGGRTISYVVPLDLPRQSRKRYHLYVPATGLKAAFLRAGAEAEKVELGALQGVRSEDRFVVVVGGDPGFLSFLSGTAALGASGTTGGSGGPGIRVAHAPWNTLPDHWLGWDGVDVAVLGDAALSSAPQAGVEALQQWLRLGGTLIVPGGAAGAALSGTSLEPLLPVTVAGTEAAPSVPELARWAGQPLPPGAVLLARGNLRSGAEALLGSSQRPLAAQCRVGSGRVVMTAFDFTAAPLKYWNGQTAVWQRLLGQTVPLARLLGPVEDGADDSLGELATSVREGRMASYLLVITFLLVYLLVLGPGQYLVLGRWDRRELAWITTPVVVACFTLGAYFVSLGARGGKVVVQRVMVIEAESGATAARGQAWLGLFSPRMSRYEFRLGEGVAGARLLPYEEDAGGEKVAVIEGPEPRVKGLGLNMWTARGMAVSYQADLGKGLVVEKAEWDGKVLRARVRNGTRMNFRTCGIVAGGTVAGETPLAAGATVSPGFDRARAKSLAPGPVPGASPPYGPGQQAPAEPELGEALLGAAFGAIGGPRSSPVGLPQAVRASPGAYLTAVCRDQVLPVDLVRHRPRTEDATLLAIPLRVTVPAGLRADIPGWLVRMEAVGEPRYAGAYPTRSGGGGKLTVPYTFRVPVGPHGGTATMLRLVSPGPGGPGGPPGGAPPQTRTVRAFNYRTQSWEAVPGAGGRWEPRRPGDFMSPEGKVQAELVREQYDGTGLIVEARIVSR